MNDNTKRSIRRNLEATETDYLCASFDTPESAKSFLRSAFADEEEGGCIEVFVSTCEHWDDFYARLKAACAHGCLCYDLLQELRVRCFHFTTAIRGADPASRPIVPLDSQLREDADIGRFLMEEGITIDLEKKVLGYGSRTINASNRAWKGLSSHNAMLARRLRDDWCVTSFASLDDFDSYQVPFDQAPEIIQTIDSVFSFGGELVKKWEERTYPYVIVFDARLQDINLVRFDLGEYATRAEVRERIIQCAFEYIQGLLRFDPIELRPGVCVKSDDIVLSFPLRCSEQ